MHKYKLISKKGEGTFSEVLKAQCVKTGQYVAIKRMRSHFDSIEQVNNLREIQALRRLSNNPSIIKLLEVLYDRSTGRLALVFELMELNAYELIRNRRTYLPEAKIKWYMYQLLKAMDFLHRNGIFHRDIKPENILIADDVLKLADFGSCRGMYTKQPYTEYISTRWYRAPECLLTDGYYSYKMDLWGVGCVWFEIMSLFPLFPGINELDQINKIHAVLGTPSPEVLAKFKKRPPARTSHAHVHSDSAVAQPRTQITRFRQRGGGGGHGHWEADPHVSPECIDLISHMLAYCPDDRYSARQALRHPYFRDLREAERRLSRQGNSGAHRQRADDEDSINTITTLGTIATQPAPPTLAMPTGATPVPAAGSECPVGSKPPGGHHHVHHGHPLLAGSNSEHTIASGTLSGPPTHRDADEGVTCPQLPAIPQLTKHQPAQPAPRSHRDLTLAPLLPMGPTGSVTHPHSPSSEVPSLPPINKGPHVSPPPPLSPPAASVNTTSTGSGSQAPGAAHGAPALGVLGHGNVMLGRGQKKPIAAAVPTRKLPTGLLAPVNNSQQERAIQQIQETMRRMAR
ncbi:putative MAPK/MAK/MRK overlapping kinase [Paratrimastix pyriformis]|uniref:MAPK/MAK/MRK overlapping kinase n=1 Tax=Paratrimastix pyriformis TaxID=342808 RepID=A0ABQ8UVT8_9EUKA|nr:putative MAPK/MAK/MRK overlapping kinase [Paratrimastix pyriformis]